jgi:hypothetical protein
MGRHFHRHDQLTTAHPGGEEERDTVSNTIMDIQAAVATAQQLARVTQMLDAYFLAGQRQGHSRVIKSIQNRIIINGLSDPKIKFIAKRAELGGAAYEALQDTIALAEKSQMVQIKLVNMGYKNSMTQQTIKTSTVDTYETADKAGPEVAMFNNKGKGKGKGEQEPVPKPQPSMSGDQGKKTKKKINFSKPPKTPCNCPIKAKIMAQFLKQIMPLHQMASGPHNMQWLGNANVGRCELILPCLPGSFSIMHE